MRLRAGHCQTGLAMSGNMRPESGMNADEQFRLYRAVVAGEDGQDVCWWYSGLSTVHVPNYPAIPVLRASAVMTYRTETVSKDTFKIHWSEIGCFFDHASGAPPRTWKNPITGATVTPPTSFEEGPGAYTVSLRDDGVHIQLDQPHAQVDGVALRFANESRLHFMQSERKVRGFPLSDGSLPPPGSGFRAETGLHFFASLKEDCAVSCQGVYSFELSGLPPWIGLEPDAGRMVTRGTITKAQPGEIVDQSAWEQLKKRFPDHC